MRKVFLLAMCFSAVSYGQQPPYDTPPDVAPPYYRVRYGASETGALVFPVQYTVWIPPGVAMLRGIVIHQHGCGEGSCRSGQTGAFDLHWQALAEKHDCALLAPSYEQRQSENCQLWCDPRNGSAKAVQDALEDLARTTGHRELASVPWAIWGHSGGGHWCGGIVLTQPERVIAAWLRSGVPFLEANPERPEIKPHQLSRAALRVPIMCNPGTKEGVTVKDGRFARVWPMNKEFFSSVRQRGGLIGVSVDPLTAHECGNQRYLAIRWLDACMTARLPTEHGQPLRPMPVANAWLAPLLGTVAVPQNEFEGDPAGAVWLPDETIATAWQHYVTDTKIPDPTRPPAPSNVRFDNGLLEWSATADLESGIAWFEIYRDGRRVGTVPSKPANRFGRPLFQGLQYSDTPAVPLAKMAFRDPEGTANSQYKVIVVNTMGGKSN